MKVKLDDLNKIEFDENDVPVDIVGKGIYYTLNKEHISYSGEVKNINEEDKSIGLIERIGVIDYSFGFSFGPVEAYRTGPVIKVEENSEEKKE
jgi:hypothetical protein